MYTELTCRTVASTGVATMTTTNNDDKSRATDARDVAQAKEKFSRREFAKTSVVAGAAAMAIPGVVRAETYEPQTSSEAPAAGSAIGKPGTGRHEYLQGTTIPAEYYYEMEHYKKDERYIAETFWLMADHVSRIPEPGDYFVFKFGLGDSAIVVRGKDKEIRAFHNVCRHRGSRLCRHDEDPRIDDARLSVRQLGESGNAQSFRCPYHAWLYDLDGSLMKAYDVHDDFDMDANGLVPCHMRVEEGHVFLNFSRGEEPPDFEVIPSWRFREIGKKYSMADLKVGPRKCYPLKANWKLALENFLECYHCGPVHKNLVTTHNYDYSQSAARQERWDKKVAEWIGPELAAHKWESSGGPYDGELNPGFVTGSLEGKRLAPLLPGIDDWTHDTDCATTAHSTGYWQVYDDYVAVARFTPRGPELTDAEIFWLVHPDAVAGKDYDPDALMALWDITMLEDVWIVENNHVGVKSGGYRAGRYSVHEVSPSAFVAWYMKEVVQA